MEEVVYEVYNYILVHGSAGEAYHTSLCQKSEFFCNKGLPF